MPSQASVRRDTGRLGRLGRPAYLLFFLQLLRVSVTVVRGFFFTVDFFTNRPVTALRLIFRLAISNLLLCIHLCPVQNPNRRLLVVKRACLRHQSPINGCTEHLSRHNGTR